MTLTLEKVSPTQAGPAKFFASAIANNALAHGYVLQGGAVDDSYKLALEIAKILNCTASPQPGVACGECKDCRWVSANSHPAVITISRKTYMEEKPLTTAFKSIRAEQVTLLLNQLGYSTEHKRVVIFTNMEELPGGESSVTPPYEWQEANDGKDKSFHIRPLLRSHFSEASSNRFLKTLEEPPKNTMFFFITDNEQNLLETIVSRCQLVRMTGRPAAETTALDEACRPFFESLWPALSNRDFYQTTEAFKTQLVEERELTPEQAVALLQNYVRARFQLGMIDDLRYAQVQRLMDEAGRRLRDKVSVDQSLNGLFERLAELPLR